MKNTITGDLTLTVVGVFVAIFVATLLLPVSTVRADTLGYYGGSSDTLGYFGGSWDTLGSFSGSSDSIGYFDWSGSDTLGYYGGSGWDSFSDSLGYYGADTLGYYNYSDTLGYYADTLGYYGSNSDYLGYTDYYTATAYDVYDVGYSYVPTYTAPSLYSAPIAVSKPVGVAAPVRIAAPSYYTAPVGHSMSSTYTAPLFTSYPVGTSQPISNTTIDNSISGSYNTYDYSINDSFNTYTNITNNPAPVYTATPQYTATAVLPPSYYYYPPTYPNYYPSYSAPYVSLNQIPYTGFDGGPIGNTFYWLGITLFAVAMAYLAVYYIPALFRVKQMVPTRVMEAPIQFARSAASTIVAKPAKDFRAKTGSMLSDSMTLARSLNGEAPRIVITRS
ncbi:hypothetical protein C4556_00110 [Candidatus Parcubacteria bacterium]|nr:MAG: hypothetical protein C4556_00110 [Candidatus Parcubacteria bacterium]